MKVFAPDPWFVRDARPRVRIYRKAFATPTLRLEPTAFSGAVYDKNGRLIRASVRWPGNREKMLPHDPETIDRPTSLRSIDGTTCYIGHSFGGHYGHLLTEGISSLWWAAANPGRYQRIAVHPFIFGSARSPVETWAWQRLGLAGASIYVIREATEFERVIVPERLWWSRSFAYRHYRRVLRKLAGGRMPAGSRDLYLSRRNVRLRRVENEHDVEALFAARGFDIVQPEMLPFEEQIRLYRNARTIAGFAGSNLHNVLLAPPGTRVISIQDFREPVHANQLICGALMKGDILAIPTRSTGNSISVDDVAAGLAEMGL